MIPFLAILFDMLALWIVGKGLTGREVVVVVTVGLLVTRGMLELGWPLWSSKPTDASDVGALAAAVVAIALRIAA